MKRYCNRLHVVEAAECTRATVLGIQREGLHCPYCGLLTQEVGDLRSLPAGLLRVLDVLATGDCSKDIAARLNVSPGTLKVYISRLFVATGKANRVSLALMWIRHQEALHHVNCLKQWGVPA